MLQQILRDMYIEPELLAELSEEQKQILFVKMREEQVRRWTEHEEKDVPDSQLKKRLLKKDGKKVNFLLGRDGNEWVWVMGHHANDKTIEHILEEEAQAKALQQAEKEAEEVRKKEENMWKKKDEADKRQLEKEKQEVERVLSRKREEAALYQNLKEARRMAKEMEEQKLAKEAEEKKKMEELQVVTERRKKKSLERYDHMRNRRSSEIYIQWREMRSELEKTAEESSREVEASWMEQEKKSKEAELKMRELARNARKEYKESLKRTNRLIQAAKAFSHSDNATKPTEKPPVPPKKHLQGTRPSSIKRWTNRPSRPSSRSSVISWFQQEELPRGAGYSSPNTIAPWFHGIISRSEAENLLNEKPCGSFLVRVSERVWGYTISFHGEDRVKHFLVDTSEGGYQFLGASQIQHSTLADLVKFHKENAITISGGEKLLFECGQVQEPPDYADLFSTSQSEGTIL